MRSNRIRGIFCAKKSKSRKKVAKNKNTQYSQALIRYGNNLRRYASENYGINISILIDKYAPVNLVQIGMTILIMLIILAFQKFLKRTP